MSEQEPKVDETASERGSTIQPNNEFSTENQEKSYLAISLIAALCIAALLLIFLPGQFQKSAVEQTNESEEVAEITDTANTEESEAVSAPPVTGTATAPPETPFADAQRQQARMESQAILSELLTAIRQLEQLRVEEWGKTENTSIQEQAEAGDLAYQEMSYEQAIELYQQALTDAKSLMDSGKNQAVDFFELGKNALDNDEVSSAVSNLELATLLDPEFSDAQTLLARAQVREEASELISSAQRLREDGQFEEARELYTQVQGLDSEFENIAAIIAEVDEEIIDRDYRIAMSQGFSFLSQSELAQAETAFNRAGRIRPGNPAVADALQQIEAARINNQRQIKLDNAIALEASEQWSQALRLYKELLAEDATMTPAQLGEIRSQARTNLHDQIQTILDEPLSLQAEDKWQGANQVLAEATDIINRGPVLTNQIDQLEMVVKRARTKITVALSSDRETNVEIFRVGNLGQFREHAVALFPGRYVLVGTRSGYRDVREDLVLDGTESRVELNIQCVEAI